MEQQSIRFINLEQESFLTPTDAWLFAPRKKAWLARLAWKLLKKLEALKSYEARAIRYTETVVHPQSLFEAINRQISCAEELYHGSVTRLVVGSKTFAEMRNESTINRYIDFAADIRLGNGNRGVKLCGLNVEVVPWLDGMAVLP